MRTERRKTSLDNVSRNYHKQAQFDKERRDRQRGNGGVSPSPFVGTAVGACGTVGSLIAWLSGVPTSVAVILALLGCVGAVCCRGNNGDYDSVAARICVGAAVCSAVAGIIILTFYFKELGIWEFTATL